MFIRHQEIIANPVILNPRLRLLIQHLQAAAVEEVVVAAVALAAAVEVAEGFNNVISRRNSVTTLNLLNFIHEKNFPGSNACSCI